MAWRSGRSLTRSLMSSARAPPPSLRSSPPLTRRLRPLPSRNFEKLGCMQSFLPLHTVVAKGHLTSHLNSNLRAFCELSHGTGRVMGLANVSYEYEVEELREVETSG